MNDRNYVLIKRIEELEQRYPEAAMSVEMFDNIKNSEVMLFYRYVQLLDLKNMKRDSKLSLAAPDGREWKDLIEEKESECSSSEHLLGLISNDDDFKKIIDRNKLMIEETLGFAPREDFYQKYDEEVEKIINIALGRNREEGFTIDSSVVAVGNVELSKIYLQGDSGVKRDIETEAKTPLSDLQGEEVPLHVDQINHNLVDLIKNGMIPRVAINGQFDKNIGELLNQAEKLCESNSNEELARKYQMTVELGHVVSNLSVLINSENAETFSMQSEMEKETAKENCVMGGFFELPILGEDEAAISDVIDNMENSDDIRESFEMATEYIEAYDDEVSYGDVDESLDVVSLEVESQLSHVSAIEGSRSNVELQAEEIREKITIIEEKIDSVILNGEIMDESSLDKILLMRERLTRLKDVDAEELIDSKSEIIECENEIKNIASEVNANLGDIDERERDDSLDENY